MNESIPAWRNSSGIYFKIGHAIYKATGKAVVFDEDDPIGFNQEIK